MRVTVLGAGSWGTALAVLLEEKGYPVRMWEFFPELADELDSSRVNEKMLPGVRIPGSIVITSEIGEALEGAEVVLFVVPTIAVRSTATAAAPCLEGSPLIVNAAKGIEQGTMMRVSEILEDTLPERFIGKTVTLSGPSHAEEVSGGIPTTVVAASPDAAAATLAQTVGRAHLLHASRRRRFSPLQNGLVRSLEIRRRGRTAHRPDPSDP